MNKKITCPVCQFEFAPDLDSSGICECPSCESALLWGTGQISDYDYVTEFEDCVLEAFTLLEEARGLDDESLEDEIAHEATVNDYMVGTFNIFTEMDSTERMAFDTRRLAEGIYVLMHSKMMFGYEQ